MQQNERASQGRKQVQARMSEVRDKWLWCVVADWTKQTGKMILPRHIKVKSHHGKR
jgi:hypothetical protein